MRPTLSFLERVFPFLAWRHQLGAQDLRHDFVAGVTVALVLIPQSLAYAQLAGLPPHVGLYAAILPVVIGALFGSCGQLSTGPVALTALLSGASVMQFAPVDSPEFLSLTIFLALLSGTIQLALGAFRVGWLLNLLSRPVLTGFVNAAALLICLSQIPPLFGIRMPRGDDFLRALWQAFGDAQAFHSPSLAFGCGALAALLALRRFAPRLPGVLIVAAGATAISAATGFAASGGAIIGAIPTALPDLGIPLPPLGTAIALAPAAFVIALVSFMEAASSARLITAKSGQAWDQNQELIGQGLAKVAAAVSGSMPVSASFSRSALNHASGARSGLSSLVATACTLLTLLYLTPLLHDLPIPVLAAIILQVVAGLLDPRALTRAWQAGRDDGLAFTITFATTLAFAPNIQNGILTGLLLALALMLYRDMSPRSALLGLHPDGTYRDLQRFGLAHPHPKIVILRFDSPLTFVTAAAFEAAVLDAARAQREVRTILVSAAGINSIDATGLHTISSLMARLESGGRTLAFCGLKKQVIDAMQRTELWQRLEQTSAFRTEAYALQQLAETLAQADQATPLVTDSS